MKKARISEADSWAIASNSFAGGEWRPLGGTGNSDSYPNRAAARDRARAHVGWWLPFQQPRGRSVAVFSFAHEQFEVLPWS
jgi:hypothetical protein